MFMMSFDLCLCVMMQISGDKGISAFPESDNLFKWVGTIDGAQGTVSSPSDKQYIIMLLMSCTISLRETLPDKMMHDVMIRTFPLIEHPHPPIVSLTRRSLPQVYDGLRYRLSLDFPAGYPYQAPRVKFVTPCFHPNVDEQGFICLDILKDKWSALFDVRSILLSIQSLLGGNQFTHCLQLVAVG